MTSNRPNRIDLDDPRSYRELDSDGMLDRLHEFPAECRKAWDLAGAFALPPECAQVDKVVVLGMGGSAIGGDLVGSMVVDESRVPLLVQRGYRLPGYVDRRTLVIASSYSGSTEETLSCFEQSLASGARNLAITTGGRLKALAETNNVPVFTFDYKSPPRAALPYSLMVLLRFLQRLDLIRDRTAEVGSMLVEVADQAGRIEETVQVVSNQAKQIARDLHGRLAVIYGGEMLSEVAHRWKTQVNENSNAWAFHEAFPELDHNAVVGYEFPPGIGTQVMVVMLASSFLSPRVQLRYEVTGRLLKNAGVSFRIVRGEGTNRLSEVVNLVLLGDYVSYYLALLNGTDPGAVYAIDYLKSELAKR